MKAKAERIGRAVDEAARKLAEYRKAEARLVFLAQIGEPRSAAPVAGTVSLDGTWRFPGKCAVAFVRPATAGTRW
jgi:hypothetical protein